MARGFNKVILLGNITRDPELRHTIEGRPVATFTVAVNRSYLNKEGAQVDEVDFIPVVVWGRQAENCYNYLKKGRTVLVEGRLRVRSYEDKRDGRRKRAFDVVALRVQFLGGPTKPGEEEEVVSLREEEDFPFAEEEEEDVPF